jgi:phage shock protein A
MSDSDLYGDDIRLWSERQGALLRRLATGEAVSEQVDWRHVVEEIEDLGHGDAHPPVQDEIAQLTARLAAAEALVKELRGRLDSLTGKLADTQAELTNTQDRVKTATARAAAAVEAEQAMRQADVHGEGRGAGPGSERRGGGSKKPGRRGACP